MELMIAMIITAVILALVASFFIQVTKVTSSSVQTGNSSAVASNAMYEIANVVHQATTIPVSGGAPLYAISSATASSLVVYSYVDVATSASPAPTRVTFSVTPAIGNSNASLVETRCVATASGTFWTFTSCASTLTRNIGGTIIAPTAGQNSLFTYLDSTGNTVALVSGSVPTSSLANIASVTVSVNVQAAGSATAPVYLTSNVGMPNLGLQIATP
ncbi:MAG: hypothetical protein M3N46_14800 [Actinomycetota bacterium]|nr:hypothetical protein [Actinomycetota bacterium]